MKAGIESMGFYAPRYYLDLRTLAAARGVDPDKYYLGIGQERMSVPSPDEDVVTMAANAAAEAMAGVDSSVIDTLMFATESGIDQSKAAAIYVHRLLSLPTSCTAFELKQACCSSTAGLQMALALVAQRPEKKVLVVASDVARYGLGNTGEPTQGAGAVAMVISARPRLLDFDRAWGTYTDDVMDFWRPNYMDEALVDGKYSIKVYLTALAESWRRYVAESGRPFGDFHRFCYHLPFTRMAHKAHAHLARLTRCGLPEEALWAQIEDSLLYNRATGNTYTASLYEGVLSLLENSREDLGGRRLGLFSYGSGCMAAFFSGTVLPGYQAAADGTGHRRMLEERQALSYPDYVDFYTHRLPMNGQDYQTPRYHTGGFRLAAIRDHKRIYEQCSSEAAKAAAAAPACPHRTVAVA